MNQDVLEIIKTHWVDLLCLTGSGVVVLIWLRIRGKLSANAFDDAPRDDVGLTLIDMVGGYLAIVIGGALSSLLRMGFEQLDMGSAIQGDAIAPAAWNLIQQSATIAFLFVYLFWRLNAQADWARQFGFLPKKPLKETWAAILGLAAALPLTFGTSAVVTTVAKLFQAPPPSIGHKMLEQMVTTQQTPAGKMGLPSASKRTMQNPSQPKN